MTIRGIEGKGVNRATAICDVCGREETVTCGYHRTSSSTSAPDEGQVIQKLATARWSLVKGSLRCPTCEADRKVQAAMKKQEIDVADIKTAPRHMTPEQEVDIIVALSAVYDRKARRYQGAETDRTVADVLGVMPGWVSEVRAAKFGPAGNEEAEAIRASLAALRDDTGRKLDALSARLDACVAAHDKRVK